MKWLAPVLMLFALSAHAGVSVHIGAGPLGGVKTSTSGSDELPNIVIIVIDDIGPGGIGATGIGTPGTTTNIDALATQGKLFTLYWAPPVCSPTRASMLTGKYPSNHGVGAALAVDGSVANRRGGITASDMNLAHALANCFAMRARR